MEIIRKKLNRNNLKSYLKNSLNLLIDFSILFYLVFRRNINDLPFKFIVISDSYYFKNLINLLDSIIKYEKNPRILLYDIGLNKEELNHLISNFEIEIKKFEFQNYPKFVSERDEFNKLGSYSWKPIILQNEFNLTNENIIYLDSRCLITKELKLIKLIVKKIGFFSPESSNKIKDWTHETTLKEMRVDENFLNKRNVSAGILGIGRNIEVENLINKWYESSIIEERIAPKGSSRLNHRQDQAILSICIHRHFNHLILPRTHKIFGILKHQDVD